MKLTVEEMKEQVKKFNEKIAELEPKTEEKTQPKTEEKTLDEVQKEHDEKKKQVLLKEMEEFDKLLNASNEDSNSQEFEETAEGTKSEKYDLPLPNSLKNKLKKAGRYDPKTGKYNLEVGD